MKLTILQICVSVAIVILILLQERGSGISGLLGGGDGGSVYQTRRGLEKGIFAATIILSIVFVGLSILKLFV